MFGSTSIEQPLRRVRPVAIRRGAAARVLLFTFASLVSNVPIAAEADAPNPPIVTGSVTYRQRSALPPNAIVNVRLEDVSRADAAAPLVAELTMSTGDRQVPFNFVLSYVRAAIDDRHRYALRATIGFGKDLLFTSTAHYPVLTGGAPDRAEIVVVPISAAASVATPTLEGVNWQLIELNGVAIPGAPGTRAGDLTFDVERKRIVASGGCNRLTGSYARKEEALTIAPDASTMMGCPQPLMDREAAFVSALRATTAFRLTGDRLELLDGNRVVARFHAPSR